MKIIRISPQEMNRIFFSILSNEGLDKDKAHEVALLFMENSLEGVYTHGVNRFPRFIQYIRQGDIIKNVDPVQKIKMGALEQWDGQLGPGPSNAMTVTHRAMTLATEFGIGCVALANTNHWMRGGRYGRLAAKKGFIFIGWTNTTANMPAWGALDVKLGNNPLVLAVPYQDDVIVLDMAMSQYSFGTLEYYQMRKEKLPVPGGYDIQGNLSTHPSDILESNRVLPVGFWKGVGLSLLLDIMASILSGGLAVHEISAKNVEAGLSQVFIAIDVTRLHQRPALNLILDQIIADYKGSQMDGEQSVVYPGERARAIKKTNLRDGIPVSQEVWDTILSLLH